ncbi:hypothetical protein [Vibrio aerogenes]|uniref:hypothetical protein n=1 Tax=Vibrio aerogenes TaxID=92172 RepID=UPI0021C476F4|nr:hypothetical protein [Vibrio aerogenes]
MADNLYHYKLTDKGILYTQQQVIPEVTYSIVRGTAWVGIGVCILAAALVGPLAFVGAGAFALMSFSMTQIKPVVNEYWIYFQGAYEFAHLKNEKLIKLSSDIRSPNYSGTIYCDQHEQPHLLELLQSIIPGSQAFEVTRFRDIRDFIHSSRKTGSSDAPRTR